MRRWRRICPSDPRVFPSEARSRSRKRSQPQPLHVDHDANDLRPALAAPGATREKVFDTNDNGLRIRAHDLRATFVTLTIPEAALTDN